MSFDSTIHDKAIQLTKLTYEITGAAGSGHPSSGASLAHLVSVLLYQQMRFEPMNPGHPASDRLVLSEGHAVPVLYAAMADLGIAYRRFDGPDDAEGTLKPMTHELARTLRAIDSPVDGHPNPALGFPFFDAATGSLGQGLSVAAGLALAARMDGLGKRIYCLIGDGESREGQVWEAVDFLIDHGLKAVCPVFNANRFAQSEAVSVQQSADVLVAKLEAAGFDVRDVDGHAPEAVAGAFSAHAQAQHNPDAAPVALVARTVKGWGAQSQHGNGHHGTAPTGEALEAALAELDAKHKQLGATADVKLQRDLLPPEKPGPVKREQMPAFDEACRSFGQEEVLAKGVLATRKAYGISLRALGHARGDVAALDADVSGSTGSASFKKDPELTGRFIECRIAEQNMVSAALGMAAGGKLPVVSTFGKFLTRAYDQVEMAVLSGQPLRLVGSHAGCTLGPDGPSQMALPDVAWFRSFGTMRDHRGHPGFYVCTPADAWATHGLVAAMADHPGSVYLRTMRPETEFLYGPGTTFTLGGHEVLNQGRDLLIVAQGYMVHQANAALEALDAQGVDATIVDLYSLPFDEEALADLANDHDGRVLTLEDNYGGGMGSAVADALAATGDGFTVKQMHVERLPKSGADADDILAYVGLSVDDVVREALGMLEL
ncbi:transketolase [Phycisphaera mikurensis]|uniref:Transketolase n=1 Tax=Phycisphaera mikurensis (strain NBRC 102666 / KCTC 22515 / FYK2301M01) TaxID=1142394 RepID=I0IFL3_PHYMF|nr:transketolase [Phycisphaera mikurensis]MBB6440557.1 transketolase [Phycisphaera mikurensis]BAM04051.1 transketolase [Phycisphaera mikurensis NBRC 102666]